MSADTISVYVRFRDNGEGWTQGQRLRSPTHIALTRVPTTANDPVYVRIDDYTPCDLDTTQPGRTELLIQVTAALPPEFRGLRYMSERDAMLDETLADDDCGTDYIAEAVTARPDEHGDIDYWRDGA